MDESTKLVNIIVSVILSAALIGIITLVMSIGQTQVNKLQTELGGMDVQYELGSLDEEYISGSAIHALIVRGVPIKESSTGPNLTREQARISYPATEWFLVEVLDGNQETVLIKP